MGPDYRASDTDSRPADPYMAPHRIFIDQPLDPRTTNLVVTGDEAHHAIRVKRLEVGDPVQVLDGRGRIAGCAVAATGKDGREWVLRLNVGQVEEAAPTRPRIEVLSAVPKGPRVADLIDGLSQVGAASWAPLETSRSVSDARPAKLERLERTAMEAAKQSGRAWRLEIGPGQRLDAVLRAQDAAVVVADASGEPYRPSGAPVIRLLVGPEGGWTNGELAAARAAGAAVARFGPHTMRIEVATAVAAAIILDAEGRLGL